LLELVYFQLVAPAVTRWRYLQCHVVSYWIVTNSV